MQKIGDDKVVYNTIEEIVDPSHTALVVWDVQHGTTKVIFNKEEFSRNLNSVVELGRKSNIPIFFTPIQMLPKRFESSSIIYPLGKLGFDRLFEQTKFPYITGTLCLSRNLSLPLPDYKRTHRLSVPLPFSMYP